MVSPFLTLTPLSLQYFVCLLFSPKVQMQLICVLIGFCSILAIQKQKKATASLFDQRKRINNDAYFWQGSDNNIAATTSKGNGEGMAAASMLGDVEMV